MDYSYDFAPPVVGMDYTPPQCDRQTVTMPVYHWTEINSLCSRLTPGMLDDDGVVKKVNCRLRGESPIGANRTPPQVRLVRHDVDYCVYRLRTLLRRLSPEQTKAIFDRYLEKISQIDTF